MAGDINRMLRAQKDDRPILVILEGPDGAGKSSTTRRLKLAFEGAREIVETHFGRPPEDHEDIHWLKRFVDALPKKGTVAIWDRSYYGRTVYEPHYGMIDDKELKQSVREIRDFEGMIRDKVRVIKIYLDVPDKGLARTIAKREVLAPEKLEASDYASYRDRDPIRARFEHAVDKTDCEIAWHRIDMSDRGDGRAEMFRVLEHELK
jgi:polyphosphate kinase 2 (PPK2 family)